LGGSDGREMGDCRISAKRGLEGVAPGTTVDIAGVRLICEVVEWMRQDSVYVKGMFAENVGDEHYP
jgi:hypothetical protein